MSGTVAQTELLEGKTAAGTYSLTPEILDGFLALFGDGNPIHTDDEVANRLGFTDKVTHGVILNGFISHFIGSTLPGGSVLLYSLDTRFKSPCHLGDDVQIEGKIEQVSDSVGVAVVALTLTNTTRGRVAATARAHVRLLE